MASKYLLDTNPFYAADLAKHWMWSRKYGKTYCAEDIWSLHHPERENYPPDMNPYRRKLEQANSPLDPDNITADQYADYLLAYLTARLENDPDFAAAFMLDLYDRSPEYLDAETIKFIEENTVINENWREFSWSEPRARREFVSA